MLVVSENYFVYSGHTSCGKGHLVTWAQAKQKCQISGGELLLQQDDLKNLCSEKENGVWVGLRKTATERKSQSKFCFPYIHLKLIHLVNTSISIQKES